MSSLLVTDEVTLTVLNSPRGQGSVLEPRVFEDGVSTLLPPVTAVNAPPRVGWTKCHLHDAPAI